MLPGKRKAIAKRIPVSEIPRNSDGTFETEKQHGRGKNRRREQAKGGLKKGQATKSARGMPWHWEPMKDVVNCDKPRGAVSKRYIRGFPNGATQQMKIC